MHICRGMAADIFSVIEEAANKHTVQTVCKFTKAPAWNWGGLKEAGASL